MSAPTKSVCILAAGCGTRMGPYADVCHKALLPVAGKAVISHLIEKFGREIGGDTHFVIAVGYKRQDVIDYVRLAHPGLSVDFVTAPGFDAADAGPGRSVLACRDQLQEPFYLACCDTLWAEIVPEGDPYGDWIAVAPVPERRSEDYCHARIAGSAVMDFHNKKSVPAEGFRTFTGVAHVKRFARFFAALEERTRISKGQELLEGFSALLDSGLAAADMTGWIDVGTVERYETLCGAGEVHRRKKGEFLYHVHGRVIKFFADPEIVRQRAQRASRLRGLVPDLVGVREHFYAYEYVPGSTLYQRATPATVACFLDWLEKSLWREIEVPREEIAARSLAFYRDKTEARLNSLFSAARWPGHEKDESRARELLGRVPWRSLADARPVTFHGDLQLENVIVHEGNPQFTLIDWRQDFAGALHWGDLYYDLAKLNACLSVDFSGEGRSLSPALRGELRKGIERLGLDHTRVELITALIFLNMAGIHVAPASHAFFREGLARLEAHLARPDAEAS